MAEKGTYLVSIGLFFGTSFHVKLGETSELLGAPLWRHTTLYRGYKGNHVWRGGTLHFFQLLGVGIRLSVVVAYNTCGYVFVWELTNIVVVPLVSL